MELEQQQKRQSGTVTLKRGLPQIENTDLEDLVSNWVWVEGKKVEDAEVPTCGATRILSSLSQYELKKDMNGAYIYKSF